MSLIDDSDRHSVYLAKLATHLLRTKLYPSLAEAMKAARAILLDAESINSVRVMRRIQDTVAKEVTPILDEGYAALNAGLMEMAVYEAGYSAKLFGSYASAALAVPAETQIARFINQAVMTLGSGERASAGTWAQYVTGARDSAVEQYNGLIARGYQGGQTVNQIAREIRNSTEGLLQREAEALARTGQSHFANSAREAMAAANADVIKVRVYTATFDNRTTLGCFPGETEVSAFGLVKNVFRFKYSGEAVTIRTASGKELTGTAKHPILTPDGFLPIGELDPGKHVVYSPVLDYAALPGDKHIGVPSVFGKLFDALCKPSISRVTSESSSATDFYGDGSGGDGKVDIATPNRELRYNIKSTLNKKIVNVFFGGVENPSKLLCFCLFLQHFLCRLPVSEAAKVASCLLEVGVKKAFGSASSSNYFARAGAIIKHLYRKLSVRNDKLVPNSPWETLHNPGSFQNAGDCARGYAILSGELTGGKTIPVFIDNIVSVERKFINTHVYTLESDNGLYTAGGIIVKNCRALHGKSWPITSDDYVALPRHWNCRSVYVYARSAEDAMRGNRAAIGGNPADDINPNRKLKYRGKKDKDIFDPGPIRASTTQDAWLRDQPAWFQDSALGETRAKLFRDGGMKIEQFTDMLGNDISLSELRRLDADAFRRAGL